MEARNTMFSRIAIVNRGEAAMRLIHAAREIEAEQGSPLTTIALYTDADRNSMFVREADESVRIHSADMDAYLDHDVLEQALRGCKAEAVWVGWGFVSEDPEFADLVERLGLVFIGPSGETMRRLGDKIGAKHLAEAAGICVSAWSGGPVADLEQARRHAETIGYPLMIKAASGGGGRGIRRVERAGDLAAAFAGARREAAAAFGDDTLLMEQAISGARHVEVQIVADGKGGIWALGVRDCSIQRRHQKVVEESASTALDADGERRAKAAAVALTEASGYHGVASVEFLYQPDQDLLVFLEVNTRLQVEHAVTEVTTGVDLVKLQLHLASGGLLEGEPPAPRGHAVEVRLNAEDPERGFAPAPGVAEYLSWASGPGVRIDTGLAQDDVIPAGYDSMIAKIIGLGRDRAEAWARTVRAVRETTVVIRGGTTNKAFLAELLKHPDLVSGRFDTGWLDQLMNDGGRERPQRRAVALLSAAIDAYDTDRDVERTRFLLSALRGRPQTGLAPGFRVELRSAEQLYSVEVHKIGAHRYRMLVDDRRIEVDVGPGGPFERRLVIAGRSFRAVSIRHGAETLVEVDGLPHRVSHDDAGLVRAPSPGVLVHIRVREGDEVAQGDHLATIESMKMELAVRAPVGGRVREILAAVGAPIDAGTSLFRLEGKPQDAAPTGTAGRADFSAAAVADPDDPRDGAARALTELRAQVLGYDYTDGEAHRAVAAYRRHRARLAPTDPDTLRRELGVLGAFADVAVLSRNRRTGEDGPVDDAHSPREFFHAFLATLDTARAGLPADFEEKLRTAVAGYDVPGLERTAKLEDALLWMFLAQQRSVTLLPAILAILEFHLDHADAAGQAGHEMLAALDRLILAAQLRHPTVGTMARSVRHRHFDGPLIQSGHDETLRQMRGQLSIVAAAGTDNPVARAQAVSALVSCPLPLIRLMAAPGEGGDAERRELIEIQTRRYYQDDDLGDLSCFDLAGRRIVTGSFGTGGERTAIVAAEASTAEPADLAAALAAAGARIGATTAGVADLYVHHEISPENEAGDLAAAICDALAAAALPDGLRRVTVCVPTTAGQVARRTYERDGAGFTENPILRDLHPMVAERLRLWRLAEFDLRRLAAATDVYLFEATGRTNPDDRRLVALAEVRDLTPLRDAAGAVTAIPALEQVLDCCLESLRRAVANRGSNRVPQWNRIVLHVWPPIDLDLDDLLSVMRVLAPRTEGLGLEQVGLQGRLPNGGEIREVRLRMARSAATGLSFEVTAAPQEPLKPLDAYTRLVMQSRQRETAYPYSLIPLLLHAADAPEGPAGAQTRSGAEFHEYDLDDGGQAVIVVRPPGRNASSIVFGTVTTPTARYPEGMTRVAVLGDPTKSLGAVAEPECRRIVAALDLAERLGAPVEWLAVSSGAKIAMDSGTENMDWVARVMRRLIEFTQAGGEVNVVVTGINVGAQSYWNAEATMLMHTKGILVMTPDSTMVLTGKQSLEYSGGVAAEDNFGIGGYDRVMGPNGQAQYWAPDLSGACRILMAHHEFAYVAPGERFGRRATTTDPVERDVRHSPHNVDGTDFTTIGEIFSAESNPERKKAFDIRTMMNAVIDRDLVHSERWAEMADARTAVVFDAFLGGRPVTLIGIESRPLVRLGLLPADGPESWSGGTLFPASSKKVARAINAASGNRPVVVLANLSGFDGSPESLRRLQLEYGAEIARAIVNFDGPVVFCVVSRYHGGAFVVFSSVLNDGLEVAAVDGSYASVLGGGPAAAVVFRGEVRKRAEADPRIVDLTSKIRQAEPIATARLRAELELLRPVVRAEKQAEVADEFDRIHDIHRAKAVGSVDTIIQPGDLRPYLVEAVERGISRTEETLRTVRSI